IESSTTSAARTIASWSMSIAESTACSASSEYGGCRSRNGSRLSDGTIEYSTDELDIFPGRAFPRGIPQKCGGMIGNDQRHPVVPVKLSSELGDCQLRFEKRLRGERAERENRFRPDQLKLANEEWTARSNLIRHRIPVSRRSMLQNVADENVLSRQIHRAENFCEQLTRRPHEGEALLVFSRARRLADDHELGVRISLTRHGVRRGRVQRAARARPDGAREPV